MKAISSMATRHLLNDLATEAARAGLPALDVESTGGVLAEQRVADGEAFDLVFLASGALKRLADSGHVGDVTPLFLSQVGIAVRGDSLAAEAVMSPAFPDVASLQDAMRGANKIGYSTGPSGKVLLAMIDEWGMAEELEGRLVQSKPGIPVAQSLSEGDVDLGFQQMSELAGQRGIRILGTMPHDAAIDTIFSGAVATKSSNPAEAARVLAYLASDAVEPTTARHCFAQPMK